MQRPLVIDIETRPNPAIADNADYWTAQAETLVAPRNYKDPVKIAEWRTAEIERRRAEMALHPWHGLIVCVGVQLLGWVAPTVFWYDETPSLASEKSLLLNVLEFLGQQDGRHTLVGWNIQGFDLPWLIGRTAVHGLPGGALPAPRDYRSVVDLFRLLGEQGTLEEWQLAFGLGPKRVSGADSLLLPLPELADHCAADVAATTHIARATQLTWFRGEP